MITFPYTYYALVFHRIQSKLRNCYYIKYNIDQKLQLWEYLIYNLNVLIYAIENHLSRINLGNMANLKLNVANNIICITVMTKIIRNYISNKPIYGNLAQRSLISSSLCILVSYLNHLIY